MIFCDYFNILNTEWLWEERPERDASGRELLRVLGWWRRNRNESFSFSQVAKAGGGASCLESSTEEGNAGGRQV